MILYAGYLLHLDPQPSLAKRKIATALLDVGAIPNEAELRRILLDVAGVTAEEIVEPVRLAMAARNGGRTGAGE